MAINTNTTENLTRAFARDGYVLVPNLFSSGEMADWKGRFTTLLDAAHGLDDPSGVFVWLAPDLHPFFVEQVSDVRITRILRPLIGPDIEFLSAKPVYKNNQVTFGSPWHIDRFYWGGAPKVSVWIAVDAATIANGCLKVVPGSHLMEFTGATVVSEHGFGNQISDDDVAGIAVDTLEVEAGSAVFFSDRLVHGSHENTEGADRWCFIPTYRNSSVHDDSTVWSETLSIPVLINPIMGSYWFSIFIGWLCKSMVTKYGGRDGYPRFRNFFIGLIVGELVMCIFGAQLERGW